MGKTKEIIITYIKRTENIYRVYYNIHLEEVLRKECLNFNINVSRNRRLIKKTSKEISNIYDLIKDTKITEAITIR